MFDKLRPEEKEATVVVAKLGSVWASVGVSTWSDAASMFAAILSMLFILEWFWEKIIRPFLEDRGVMKRKRRRASDSELDQDKVGL